jgi:hypothetical protein
MRGESEGSPLGNLSSYLGVGAKQREAMRSRRTP